MPQMGRYGHIITGSNYTVSQITLTQIPHKPVTKLSMVGSEAKNPLSIKTKDNFSWTDMAGLSWILLDDPLNFSDYA
jgi:tripartite-type tricarboxylate transporter receptor subunit TctC